jgi:hypothetical protein
MWLPATDVIILFVVCCWATSSGEEVKYCCSVAEYKPAPLLLGYMEELRGK